MLLMLVVPTDKEQLDHNHHELVNKVHLDSPQPHFPETFYVMGANMRVRLTPRFYACWSTLYTMLKLLLEKILESEDPGSGSKGCKIKIGADHAEGESNLGDVDRMHR